MRNDAQLALDQHELRAMVHLVLPSRQAAARIGTSSLFRRVRSPAPPGIRALESPATPQTKSALAQFACFVEDAERKSEERARSRPRGDRCIVPLQREK